MVDRKRILLALLLSAALMAGCELSPIPQPTPTLERDAQGTATPTVEPTASPSATTSPLPQLESATPTSSIPTETPTITETPNPYATYIIQPNDSLIQIIQRPPFFYRELNVIDEIVRINPNIESADRLPGPGSSILIPLPTGTPTPENYPLTASAQPPDAPNNSGVPTNAEIVPYEVREGETIIGIAGRNATTLVILATLNPQLGFFGCDFSNPSGGPDCNVPLQVGDQVNVPALTPTPTLSPTISGSETPSPTPTYAAPMLVYPPQSAVAPPRTFRLQWVSVGQLQPDEVYLVEIEDETAQTQHIDVTRSTSYELPAEMIPADGQSHAIRWRVSVAAPNAQGAYRYIGAQGQWRSFSWQSR